MSNRASAFLLLLAICAGLLGFVYYYFIANVGNLLIDVGDSDKVHIQLTGEFQNSYEDICNRKCVFKSIPTVNYSIVASKEGYKDFASDFKIERGQTRILRVGMKKEVGLVQAVKSNDQKILELKYKKYTESLPEQESANKRIVIGIHQGKLVAYSSNSGFKIYSYDGETETIDFFQDYVKANSVMYNSLDNIISYIISDGNFIYDVPKKTNYKLNIGEKVSLVKRSSDDEKYIVITDGGAYLYSTDTNDYIKNTLFDDFIILRNNKVLGLIKKDSKEKLSILNFAYDGKNKLVLHDLKTRERKIIFEIDGDVRNIMNYDKDISYADSDNKIYSLKELEIE